MSMTARLINDGNYPYQRSWNQYPYPLQENVQYARPQRKLLSGHNQYELLEPSYVVADQPKPPYESADPTVSRISTKRSRGWVWESISFAVAVACFATIVVMLLSLQNRPTPNWPSGLSVNAILSVIVTVMKGAMGICIADCLSQIKWHWFKRERKLIDLVIIDEASRGILGAVRLLFAIRAWYLAYVGSFCFLIGFLIGPTVQQTVEVRVRQIELPSQATVPICNTTFIDIMGLGAGSGQNRVNLPMIGAMYNGFLQTSSQSPLQPSCQSGNCTFPRYQSLGLCHECMDYSDQLVYVDLETGVTSPTSSGSTCSQSIGNCNIQWLGAGIFLDGSYGMINSTRDLSTKVDLSLQSSDKTVFSYFQAVMSRNWQHSNGPGTPPVGVQCMVRFCIKTYEAFVRAGDFQESLIATSWEDAYFEDVDYFSFTNHLVIPAKPCYVNGTEKPEPWNEQDSKACIFNVTGQAGLSLYNTLDGLMKGQGSAYVSNRPSFSSDVMQAVYGLFSSDDLSNPDLGSFQSVDRAFKSLVDVVTDHARASVDNCGGASAEGIQSGDELYIAVRWVWLIPTTAVLTLCLAFFLATVAQSWREDLWKSSPLAYIFCRPVAGHSELTAEHLRNAGGLGANTNLNAIEKASKNISVRFRHNTRSYRH